jgi:NAD(P)-dependent dehydrogenase (short-subunit alcohol dehydrogenase family)
LGEIWQACFVTADRKAFVKRTASPFDIRGRRAIVTGASSGLGRRFAQVLDAAGARVAIVARRQGMLEELAEVLTDPLVIVADLADPSSASHVIDSAYEGLGGVDILINNAGRAVVGPALDDTAFRSVVDLNLIAPFELSRLCAERAIDDASALSIINVTSILGIVASRSLPQASYAASKAGLAHLTRQLAAEWARSRIRVNAIAPGWFPTELTKEAMFDDPKGSQFVERNTPMGRGGADHELDGPLLFLASDASSYVTGQVVVVDGGWTIV